MEIGHTLSSTWVVWGKYGDIPDLVIDDQPTVIGGIVASDFLRGNQAWRHWRHWRVDWGSSKGRVLPRYVSLEVTLKE
jgi:hypothetical protein